mgnify:CR=1 FL=1
MGPGKARLRVDWMVKRRAVMRVLHLLVVVVVMARDKSKVG